MKKITPMELLDGYEKLPDSTEKSFFCRSISGKISPWRKKSKIIRGMYTVGERLAYTSTRFYGILLLVWGLLTILIQFTKNSFGATGSYSYSTLITGAALSLISTPLLAFDRPLCIGLQEWLITDYVLFDFFRIKRMHRQSTVPPLHPVYAILIGTLPAAVGYFVPTYIVALAIGAALFIYMSFISPEFSFFSTLLMLPFASLFKNDTAVIGILVGITVFAFLRKVIFGKRVYNLEQYDIILVAMLFFLMISGIFLGGWDSFFDALNMLLLASGYFMASNIITNKHLAECAVSAVAISSVPVSVVAIVQFIISVATTDTPPARFDITSTFNSGGALAAYLTVAVIVSVVMVRERTHPAARLLFVSIAALALIALALAFRLDALLALALALTFTYAVKKNRNAVFLTTIVYFLLHLIFLIPMNFTVSVVEFIGFDPSIISERASLLTVALEVFRENAFFGIGIGDEAFIAAASALLDSTAPDSKNLLLQLACEGGIFVLVFFLLLLAARLRHIREYSLYIEDSQIKSAFYGTVCGIMALMFAGLFEYIFSDAAIYCLFWCILGAGSALLRIAKTEHDEKIGYLADIASGETSSIDINLK